MSSVLYYALPALGSYAVLSIFFLRRPRVLHTPGVPAFCPRLAAHRGGELWGEAGRGVRGGGYRGWNRENKTCAKVNSREGLSLA